MVRAEENKAIAEKICITPEMIAAAAERLQDLSEGDGADRFMLSWEAAVHRVAEILLAMNLQRAASERS